MQALLVAVPPRNLDPLASSLRSCGLSPIVTATADHAIQLVRRSRPDVAILANGGTSPPHLLLRHLEQKSVPVVLVVEAAHISLAAQLKTAVAVVPAPPSDPEEIAAAARLAAGEHSERELPAFLEVGLLRIDFAARLAWVEDRPAELPPIEFVILAELALEAGRPLPSEELIWRVWPENASITANDVHNHIYRLREMIGDHARVPPFILNRRGYGYVLNVLPRRPAELAERFGRGRRHSPGVASGL